MAIEEGVWAVCVCISYTVDGGQLRCSVLWSGRVGWGGQGNYRKNVDIGLMIIQYNFNFDFLETNLLLKKHWLA